MAAHEAAASVDTSTHDLGDDERFGRAIDVVDWLAEQQELYGRVLRPRHGVTLHTANPSGRDAMARSIENCAGRTYAVRHSVTAGGKTKLEFADRDKAAG